MSLSWLWPWRFARHGRPVEQRPLAPRPRSRPALRLDLLEDRIQPSSTDVFTTLHETWRNERFVVDDAPIASVLPSATASAANSVNKSFGAVIGLDQSFADYSYRGTGYSVVVIDTGIDYNHADLGGGWGNRVIAGWDFANNDSDPMDDNGHGTHVAGIIGSSNVNYSGVAPGVNLIALKVLDAFGSGSFGAVEDALKWVVANRDKYNIAAINLSLGSGNYASNPFTFLEDEFQALVSQNVFLSVAAGNSFYNNQSQQGLAFPSISPYVVSVGAVWGGDYGSVGFASGARDNTTAADRIASFSQRYVGMGIFAPGAIVNSTYLNNGYKTMAGTSMAAPVVAGSAVLLRQAFENAGKSATQSEILEVMRSTGATVVDGDDENDNVTNTGLSFKRLDLYASLRSIASTVVSNVPPTLSPIPNLTLQAGTSQGYTLQGADANNDPLTYSARVLNAPTGSANPAYQLKQSLGLAYAGSYYPNTWGHNEKWMMGANSLWYAIFPNGQLRRWAGDLASTLNAQNLIATLGVEFYSDPSLLWNAAPNGGGSPVSAAISGNQLTVSASAGWSGSFDVEVTVSDGKASAVRTFTVTVPSVPAPAPNKPPVWTAIPDQRVSTAKGQLLVTLSAADPEGQPVTYSARVVGVSGATASVSGNQLAVQTPQGYSGTFTVEVTASDGKDSAATSFQVTVANTAPTIGDIAAITVPRGQTRVSFNVPIQDADGDPLNLSVRVAGIDSTAYRLDQQLGLSYAGSYYQNFIGLKEKWVVSQDFRVWYAILPNGEVRRLAGTVTEMMKPANLVATLSPAFYADPAKLWNAPANTAPRGNLSFQGTQLNLDLQEEFLGTLTLEVSVSDGVNVTKKMVTVTFG